MDDVKKPDKQVPAVGIGYRYPLHGWIFENIDEFDVFEVLLDHHINLDDDCRRAIESLVGTVPLIAHSLGLSLGTDQPPDPYYLEKIASLIDRLKISYYSEHVAFTGGAGYETATLLPVPQTEEAAEVVIKNVEIVKQFISVPFALENIAYYFDYPDSQLSDAEFFNLIIREADVLAHLDVQNLHVNLVNHGSDPYEFVASLPANSVYAMHIAGGYELDDLMVDDHGHPVRPEVLDILEFSLARQTPESIILERDSRLNERDEILEDVHNIRARVEQVSGQSNHEKVIFI